MNAVITGANGFIGSAVAEQLIRQGHNATALVRSGSDIGKLQHLVGLNIIRYNSFEEHGLADLVQKTSPEVFFHFSWKGITGNNRNESFQFSENIPFTLASIQVAKDAGCLHWIGCGSQAEYGIRESASKETDLSNPVTAYGKAKLSAGIAALGMADTLEIKATWARLFSVYGPGDHDTFLIPYLVKQFTNNIEPQLTACEQQWDYLYKTDAANAFILLAKAHAAGIYNIGSGVTITLKDVVEKIKRLSGSKSKIGYGEKPYNQNSPMWLQANVDKLKHETGWEPLVSIDDGLAETVKFFMQNSK